MKPTIFSFSGNKQTHIIHLKTFLICLMLNISLLPAQRLTTPTNVNDNDKNLYIDGENASIDSNRNLNDNFRTLITAFQGPNPRKPFVSTFSRIGNNSVGYQIYGASNWNGPQRVESPLIRYSNPQNINDGAKKYTGFSIRLDPGMWDTPNNWFLIHQIQQSTSSGQTGNYPFVALDFVPGTNKLRLNIRSGKNGDTRYGNPSGIRKQIIDVFELKKGVWYDIVVGWKFSPFYANGWASVWIKTSTETVYKKFNKANIKVGYYGAPQQVSQNKVGLYRSLQPGNNKIYFDEVRLAGSFDGAKIVETEVTTITPNKALIPDGLYSIKNPLNGQNLLAREKEGFSARMHNPGNWNDQKWLINHLGNNYYNIQNKSTNEYLEVPYAVCENFTDVTTYIDALENNQKWKIVANGTYFNILPAHCQSQALDRDYDTLNANVHTYELWDESPNQKWEIVPTLAGRTANISPVEISIFPNPVKDFITLNFGEFLTETIAIQVIDLTGKVIYLDSKSIVNQNTLTLELDDFSKGIYMLSIRSNSFSVSKQLVRY